MTIFTPGEPRLMFFAGSSREQSWNKKLARLGANIAGENGINATFIDLADYDMPIYNGDLEAKSGPPDNARKFKALMKAHTGFFIASPEYNASFSPLLKNTLDWVSHIRDDGDDVFKTRVFAVGSTSPGGMGGLRGLAQLRIVLENGLNALTLPDQFIVPRAMDAFDDNGRLKNTETEATFAGIIGKLAKAGKLLSTSQA